MTIKEYLRLHRIVIPSIYIKKYGVDKQAFYDELKLVNGIRFVDGSFTMDHNDPMMVIETMHNFKRGQYVYLNEYLNYCNKPKGEDQHVGVFAHDMSWVERYRETGSVSKAGRFVYPPILWLDIDRKANTRSEALKISLDQAEKIVAKLPKGSYTVFSSGNKGAHIAVSTRLFGRPSGSRTELTGRGKLFYNLAHRLAGDARWDNGMYDPHMATDEMVIEKYLELNLPYVDISLMRQELETIDPNLYGSNSTIRAPHSIHEKSGLYKHTQFGASFEEVFNYSGPPELIHWVISANQPVARPNRYESIPISHRKIDRLYNEMFGEQWDPSREWVDKLHNPFYDDHNPSVSVNSETGFFKDFGAESDYSLPFWKVWALWYKVSDETAKKQVMR
jgi:hypothetical protein